MSTFILGKFENKLSLGFWEKAREIQNPTKGRKRDSPLGGKVHLADPTPSKNAGMKKLVAQWLRVRFGVGVGSYLRGGVG